MRRSPWLPLIVWLLGCIASVAQGVRPEPRIGYLYPAGACRNSTVEILAGGQTLQGVKDVRVSGEGVTARIIKTYRSVRNLDGDERKLLEWRVACRRAEINGKPKPPAPAPPPANPDGTPAPEVKLPEMPVLDLLGKLDLRGIQHWITVMQRKDRMQQNNQLGEIVRLEVKVAPDAPLGMRELRFGGPQGFTNPVRFEVSDLAELSEVEPNEPKSRNPEGDLPAASLPCVFNGQVQAGDVDEFRFRAKRGMNLVVRGEARALTPYLADAVPGWFQMVVAVLDAKGREIAYDDDFRFDPDPALCFRVPEDGEYRLEIRDSIYRGREDFVYRVQVGELPFVTSVFPLGGPEGGSFAAELRGWNLPVHRTQLDASSGGDVVRRSALHGKQGLSNEIHYMVDALPETLETEVNDDAGHAQVVSVPVVVNGRIEKTGDVDVFRIEAGKNEEFVVDVIARRLRSPLDAVIHVADETGKVLAWNDDLMEKDGHLHLGDGLLTHHADPRVLVKAPAEGPLFIRVADTQRHGGPDHAYRLRITRMRPDFELRVTPSVVNAPAGAHVPVRVHVMRNDGFDGEIRLSLKDAPPGVVMDAARIPAGVSQIRTTILIPRKQAPGWFSLKLLGTCGGSEPVTRVAVPADDVMQAFLWRHLVPADEWLVCVARGKGQRQPLEFANKETITLPSGGSAEVRIIAPKWMVDRKPEPELSEAPPGITVSNGRPVSNGLAFDVKADASVKPGFETHLIIDLFSTMQPGAKPGEPARPQARSNLSGLPALPITVTSPTHP